MTHTESLMRLLMLMMAEEDGKRDTSIRPQMFEIAEMHLLKQMLCMF